MISSNMGKIAQISLIATHNATKIKYLKKLVNLLIKVVYF